MSKSSDRRCRHRIWLVLAMTEFVGLRKKVPNRNPSGGRAHLPLSATTTVFGSALSGVLPWKF